MLAFFVTMIVYGIGRLKKDTATVLRKASCYVFAIWIGATLAIFQWLNTYAISTIEGTFLFPAYSGGSIVLSTLIGIFFFKDKLSRKQACGILVGILAVVLLNF
ncbi:MAG: hypothetical protein J6R89_03390 [Clostridia bacterium]|nr:hypothetical protein [Clostridia bacterium]